MNRNMFVLFLLCFLFFLTGCRKKEEDFKEKNSFPKESQPLSPQQDLQLPGAAIPMETVEKECGIRCTLFLFLLCHLPPFPMDCKTNKEELL